MRNYRAAGARTRQKIGELMAEEYHKERCKDTKALILQLITAAALMGTIWLAATMRYSPGEIIAFAGCVVWDMLFIMANWR